jgi:phosphate transport system substrate-binding protein
VTTLNLARLLGLIFAAAISAQAGAAETPAPVGGKAAAAAVTGIVLRGDHCTARALSDLVRQFEAGKQGRITVQPFSTISGLDAVNAGTADIAGSARPAMPDRAEEKGTNFYPVAWDALVPIVSAENPVSNITLKQMHDLYLGQLKNWKDLGGVDAPINLYAIAAPLDGVEYSTRLLLFHYGDQEVSAPRLYLNVEKLEEGMAIDPHGIGMSTLSGVASNPKVKMLRVEGVQASTATVADGSYPLYAAIYLGARDDDRQHETVAKFIEFSGSESGKALLRKRALVPYADAADLIGKQDARAAFIDEHIHATAAAAVAVSSETPVSAPRATAQALQRVAPASERTQEAKERAERAAAADKDKTKTADDSGH